MIFRATRIASAVMLVAAIVTGHPGAARVAIAAGVTAPVLPPAPGSPAASFDVGSLRVDRYGSGSRAVILIPGLSCGPWAWYGVIPALARSQSVYVLTLPGFAGRAPGPLGAPGTLFASFAADVAALIEREKLVRPAVVGHSLGGTLVFALAERYPARFRALVAVDGLPVVPQLAYLPPIERRDQAVSAARAFDAIAPASYRAFTRQAAETLGSFDATRNDALVTQELTSDHHAVAQWLEADLLADLRPELPKIEAPVLEIVPYYAPDHTGPADVKPQLVTTSPQVVASYRALLTGVPRLELAPIAPARHFVQFDAPDAFLTTLTAFLDAHP